jgi:hypothetical protein
MGMDQSKEAGAGQWFMDTYIKDFYWFFFHFSTHPHRKLPFLYTFWELNKDEDLHLLQISDAVASHPRVAAPPSEIHITKTKTDS